MHNTHHIIPRMYHVGSSIYSLLNLGGGVVGGFVLPIYSVVGVTFLVSIAYRLE